VYVVKPGAEAAFERLYGPSGGWSALFRPAPGYLGTELLHDAHAPGRYVTVDRWESAAAYDAFRLESAAAYAALDRQGEALTETERLVGELTAAPR